MTALRSAVVGALALLLLVLVVSSAGATRGTKPVKVSKCRGPNAEVEQAVDGRYVYETWIGCYFVAARGAYQIGFARSVNHGHTFQRATHIPRSRLGWDPALAVAPDGTLYVSYMATTVVFVGDTPVQRTTPAVAVSTDHGRTFSRPSLLPVQVSSDNPHGNWGDRDFIAVAPDGTVYVTWDYGPRADEVKFLCTKSGSCSFAAGDFNAVSQKSSDGGRTWTMPAQVSPGFPTGGAVSAPIVVQPDGTLDVLYLAFPTDPKTLDLSPGGEFFTRSTDGGSTWSAPVAVDPGAGKVSLQEWWIDGSLDVDPAGNLFATWDTQDGSRDTAWLAWSSDSGASWSPALRVTSSQGENLVEVAAAGPGNVYVGRQSAVRGKGYATFLRRLSVGSGWTGPARRLSRRYGKRKSWPGDTFGLSTAGGRALLSWGSSAQIYASSATLRR